MERVVVFIDGSNLYYGFSRNKINKSIDFAQFAKLLAEDRKLIRIYYYIVAYKKEYDEQIYNRQQKFLARLKKTPNLVITYGKLVKKPVILDEDKIIQGLGKEYAQEIIKRLKRLVSFTEKRIDVSIAVDMVTLAYDDVYDTAILVSSDADFFKAIKVVKAQGKRVENAYFQVGQSNQLRKICDRFILINEDLISKCAQKQFDESWWF